MARDIDWPNTTTEQRRELYLAIKKLEDEGTIHRPEFYERAFGTNHKTLGPGFQNNFSTGRISARNAAIIYEYLKREFEVAANALHFQIYPEGGQSLSLSAWNAFIADHGLPQGANPNFQFMRVKLQDPDYPWVPTPKHPLTLTQNLVGNALYAVMLDSPQQGYVLVFYQTRNNWFRWNSPQFVQPVWNREDNWIGCEDSEQELVPFNTTGMTQTSLTYLILFSTSKKFLYEIADQTQSEYPIRESELTTLAGTLSTNRSKWVMLVYEKYVF